MSVSGHEFRLPCVGAGTVHERLPHDCAVSTPAKHVVAAPVSLVLSSHVIWQELPCDSSGVHVPREPPTGVCTAHEFPEHCCAGLLSDPWSHDVALPTNV